MFVLMGLTQPSHLFEFEIGYKNKKVARVLVYILLKLWQNQILWMHTKTNNRVKSCVFHKKQIKSSSAPHNIYITAQNSSTLWSIMQLSQCFDRALLVFSPLASTSNSESLYLCMEHYYSFTNKHIPPQQVNKFCTIVPTCKHTLLVSQESQNLLKFFCP